MNVLKNIGVAFKLRVHSNRWGHKDNYTLTKTEDGWILNSLKFNGVRCDKHGNPGLEKALVSESVSFPHDLGYFISDLWEASENKDQETVQSYFDQLSDWISRTEESKPNFNPLYL